MAVPLTGVTAKALLPSRESILLDGVERKSGRGSAIAAFCVPGTRLDRDWSLGKIHCRPSGSAQKPLDVCYHLEDVSSAIPPVSIPSDVVGRTLSRAA